MSALDLLQSFDKCKTKDARFSFFQYLLQLRNKDIDKIVFVEGCDDIRVYEKIYTRDYPNSKIYFIPAYGKPNIPVFFEEIELGKFTEDILDLIMQKKVTTILDSDYDKLLEINYFSNPILKRYNIKYLKVYSLENFFFLEKNLKLLGEIFKLDKRETLYIQRTAKSFHSFIKDFEVCTFFKTKAKEYKTEPRLLDLPILFDIDYYKLEIVDNVFNFKDDISVKVKNSLEEIKKHYNNEEIEAVFNYVSSLEKIRGKSFRTLFYKYISNKKIKKLPDFYDVLDKSLYLQIELPELE